MFYNIVSKVSVEFNSGQLCECHDRSSAANDRYPLPNVHPELPHQLRPDGLPDGDSLCVPRYGPQKCLPLRLAGNDHGPKLVRKLP